MRSLEGEQEFQSVTTTGTGEAPPKSKAGRRKKSVSVPPVKGSEVPVVKRIMPDSLTCRLGDRNVKVFVRNPRAYKVGDRVDVRVGKNGAMYEVSAPTVRRVVDGAN